MLLVSRKIRLLALSGLLAVMVGCSDPAGGPPPPAPASDSGKMGGSASKATGVTTTPPKSAVK